MRLRPPLILALLFVVLGGPGVAAGATTSPHSGLASRPVRPGSSPVETVVAAPTDLSEATSWAQIGATVVAFLSVGFLGFQIMSQRSDTRAGWTLEYQATYNDREFRKIAAKCTGFFQATDAADCVRKIQAIGAASWAEDPRLPRSPPTVMAANASENDLRYVLGFFETLGAAYDSNKLARRLVDNDFAVPAMYFFIDAWWYICWKRGGKVAPASHLYEQFQRFVLTVRARRPELRGEAKPDAHLRIICLPVSDAKQAVWQDDAKQAVWRDAAKLSLALSESVWRDQGIPASLVRKVRMAVLDAQERGIAAPAVRATRIPTLIAIPGDIAVVEDVWREHRERAMVIRDEIARLSSAEIDHVIDYIQRPNPAP
jgi:hypothetical protein